MPGRDATLDAWTPATRMLEALRARSVSAVELLDFHLRRVERHTPTLKAIVTHDYDHARRQAVAADAAWGRGEDVPLLGLPLTINDILPAFIVMQRLAGRRQR